jgi:hypothetical protein
VTGLDFHVELRPDSVTAHHDSFVGGIVPANQMVLSRNGISIGTVGLFLANGEIENVDGIIVGDGVVRLSVRVEEGTLKSGNPTVAVCSSDSHVVHPFCYIRK